MTTNLAKAVKDLKVYPINNSLLVEVLSTIRLQRFLGPLV